jgi:hypothetical protein
MTTENLKKHLILALIPFGKSTKAPTTFPAFSAKIVTLDSIQERGILFGELVRKFSF